jgi:hypothetical protein
MTARFVVLSEDSSTFVTVASLSLRNVVHLSTGLCGMLNAETSLRSNSAVHFFPFSEETPKTN